MVETLVGLIPAGGGCKEMLWRWLQSNEAKVDPEYAPLGSARQAGSNSRFRLIDDTDVAGTISYLRKG